MADTSSLARSNSNDESKLRNVARALEVPRESGTPLLFPESASCLTGVTANQRQFAALGNKRSLSELHELRRKAMADLISQAVAYSRSYLDLPEELTRRAANFLANDNSGNLQSGSQDDSIANLNSQPSPIILSGHQPTLYHPGIWFKHFVLDALAERIRGIPIHLIIDNDLAGTAAVKVPQHFGQEVRTGAIPIDREHVEVPFEARKIVDRDYFEAFPDRLRPALPMIDAPIVEALWRESVEMDNFGQALAARRHRFEARAGLQTLEVPLSHLCQTESFSTFVSQLIMRAYEFASVHNQTLAEFRQQHRIRSRAHPFPELQIEEDWIEVPFWIWERDDPRRRRLFCRQVAGEVVLSDREKIEVRVPNQGLPTELLTVMKNGLAIRPRAITTTMYARLFLGDWFLHGLGGAKYDELTDLLIQHFWRIPAPAFGVATATFRLPNTPYIPDLEVQLSDLENTIRRMQQQPDRFIDPGDGAAEELVLDKQKLIREKDSFVDQKSFRKAVAELDQQLREHMLPKIEVLSQERQHLEQSQTANRIWGARDYSLACFPLTLADDLRELARRTINIG